ncbi:MAG: FKBP-type peptidyl-prolyl cis-trans isomerase [Rhodanobacter sp.]
MKQVLRPTLTAAALIAALGVVGASVAQGQTVDKNKASYVVGMDLAHNIPPVVLNEVDPNIVAQAFSTTIKGGKPTMSDAEAKTVREAFVTQLKAKVQQQYNQVSAQNKQLGDAYLAKNKTQPGVKTTADGLQYQVLKQGNGPRPTANETVQINYTGSFVNGQKFDASADHGSGPAAISLSSVFPGFREGLMMMPVGSHYKLVIPSNLAYGAEPKNGFPPNATIIFDVDLVKIGK